MIDVGTENVERDRERERVPTGPNCFICVSDKICGNGPLSFADQVSTL
jgi:hypothetical protein